MEQQPSLHGNQQPTLTSKPDLPDEHCRRQRTNVYARMLAAGRPLRQSNQSVITHNTNTSPKTLASSIMHQQMHHTSNPTQPPQKFESQNRTINTAISEQHGPEVAKRNNAMPAVAYNLQDTAPCGQQPLMRRDHTAGAKCGAAGGAAAAAAAASARSPTLLECLQSWRTERARCLGMGPESFMPKVALTDVAAAQPTNFLALQDAAKHWRTCRLQTYGHEILQLVRDWVHKLDAASSCKRTNTQHQPTNSNSSDVTLVTRCGSLDAASWQPPLGLTVKCAQTRMQNVRVIDSPNMTHQSNTLCNGLDKATAAGQTPSYETLTSTQPACLSHRVGCTMSEAESRFDVDAFFGDAQLLAKQHSMQQSHTHSQDATASSCATLQQHAGGMTCMPSAGLAKRRMRAGKYQLQMKFSSRQAARQLGLIKGSSKSATQRAPHSGTGELQPTLVPGAQVTVALQASHLHCTSPTWQCEDVKYGNQLDVNAFFARPPSPNHSSSGPGILPQVDLPSVEDGTAGNRLGRQQALRYNRRGLRLDAVVQHLRLTNPAVLTAGSAAHGKLRLMVTGRVEHPWGLERSAVRMLVTLFRQPRVPVQKFKSFSAARSNHLPADDNLLSKAKIHRGFNSMPYYSTEPSQQFMFCAETSECAAMNGATPDMQQQSEQGQCTAGSDPLLPPIPLSLEPGKRSVRYDIPDHPLLRERHKYELKEDAWILQKAIECDSIELVASSLRRSCTAVRRRFKNLLPAATYTGAKKKQIMQEELRESLVEALSHMPNIAPASSSRKNSSQAKANKTRAHAVRTGGTSLERTLKRAYDVALEKFSSCATRKRHCDTQDMQSTKGADGRRCATIHHPVPDQPRTGIQFANAVAPEDFSICSIKQLRTFLYEAGAPEPLATQSDTAITSTTNSHDLGCRLGNQSDTGSAAGGSLNKECQAAGVQHNKPVARTGMQHPASMTLGPDALNKGCSVKQPAVSVTGCDNSDMQTQEMGSDDQLVRSMSSNLGSATASNPQATQTYTCEDPSLHARLVAAATAALPIWEVRRVLACKQLASPLCHAAVLQYPARIHETMPATERDRVLTAAYKRLSLLLHPDKHMSTSAGRMHLDTLKNYPMEQVMKLDSGRLLSTEKASDSTAAAAIECCHPGIGSLAYCSSGFVRQASEAFHILQEAREQLLQGKAYPATV